MNKPNSRGSLLDSYIKQSPTINGFFNFIYLALFFWLFTSICINYVEHQTFPGMDILKTMVSRVDLIPAWLLLCNYSFLAYFLQKAIIWGLPLRLALILHHILQIILFSLTIYWLFVSEWPIIQTCYFLAQMLCIWMKMHSYTYVNRDLILSSQKNLSNSDNSNKESTISTKSSSSSSEKSKSLSPSLAHHQSKSDKSVSPDDSALPKDDPSHLSSKHTEQSLHRRKKSRDHDVNKVRDSPSTKKMIKESPKIKKKRNSVQQNNNNNNNNHNYNSHSNEELVYSNDVYPKNINLRNFMYFLCAPTLVYKPNFPRTPRVRWDYFIEKVFSFLGFFFMLHICMSDYIVPTLNNKSLSGIVIVIKLMIPFTVAYMIIFYLVFDIICNGIAEVLRFADREFYTDWWNSTSWDEFANKWNKPVHHWLKQHVFLELRIHYATKAYKAIFITFLFSSLLHELFMTVLFKKIRPFLFICQMSQLVLVWLGNFFNLKGTNTGNYLFWTGLILGPPLITLIYCL